MLNHLSQIWTPLRLDLLKIIPMILGSDKLLTGSAFLESATLGIHYYDSRTIQDSTNFSPPHKDSGTLTILFRSYNGNDGLEIADLQSTEKRDSERVGLEASFEPVPTAGDEVPYVILMAGIRLQNLLGSDRVKACVHRVRCPGSGYYNDHKVLDRVLERFSLAIFCAPSVPSTRRPPTGYQDYNSKSPERTRF
jgi:isopenicillin N synthase-like dioxygenase